MCLAIFVLTIFVFDDFCVQIRFSVLMICVAEIPLDIIHCLNRGRTAQVQGVCDGRHPAEKPSSTKRARHTLRLQQRHCIACRRVGGHPGAGCATVGHTIARWRTAGHRLLPYEIRAMAAHDCFAFRGELLWQRACVHRKAAPRAEIATGIG